MTRRLALVLALVALTGATLLTGCAKDDGADTRGACGGGASGPAAGGSSAAAPNKGGRPLVAKVDEWTIEAPATAQAGKTLLTVDNVGKQTHEVVVIKGIKPGDLPTKSDGTLDESALPDGAVLGEVDGVGPGSTCDGTIELTAGDYSLVCNLVDEEDGTKVSHLAMGMVTELRVA